MTKFEKDLFISYAHLDNQPVSSEQKGWISRFHASLKAVLSMRLGRAAEIWRDDKLQGTDIFDEEIVDQFEQTAVLVSILTPRYIKSEWCTKEVTEFCNFAEQRGDLRVGNKFRIVKVLKTPVDTQESLPDAMKRVTGYDFFTYENDVPYELDPAYGKEYAVDYNRKVTGLAYEISQLLKLLEAKAEDGEPAADPNPKPTVYLAECSYDRKETREILSCELVRHGYSVLPDRELPRDEVDYVAAVESLLPRCKLAVHLVGSSYGAVPDGPTQKSVTVLQNELAAKRSKSDALRRVIWLPEGTESDQAQQKAFIKALHQDAEAQFGADLITGDFEDLKTSIHTTLKKLDKPKPKPAEGQGPSADAGKQIYLIFDAKDRKATVPIRKFLKAQGFEVAVPIFEGDAAAVRKAHQQSLATSDAVMLFYGAGDEAWRNTKDNDLKKMPGYRDGKRLLANFIYLAEPKTADKEDIIDMEERSLIDGFGKFSEAQLAAFVAAMNPGGQTP